MSSINSGSLEIAESEYDFLSYDKVRTYPSYYRSDRLLTLQTSRLLIETQKHENLIEPVLSSESVEQLLATSKVEVETTDICLKNDQKEDQSLLNKNTDPIIINKTNNNENDLVNEKEITVRYLKAPKIPKPGSVLIKNETKKLIVPAPPLMIRQMGPKPYAPKPLVVPQKIPEPTSRKVITISNTKGVPPPPRKVVIERLPQITPKPQAIINERWLPFEERKRRIIFKRPPPVPVFCKPKNIIVEWQTPEVKIESRTTYLGTINADPIEYVNRYGNSLKTFAEFPDILKRIKHDEILAADVETEPVETLVGDLDALSLVDLEKEGLSAYSSVLSEIKN